MTLIVACRHANTYRQSQSQVVQYCNNIVKPVLCSWRTISDEGAILRHIYYIVILHWQSAANNTCYYSH
jgi:hypothetical protein